MGYVPENTAYLYAINLMANENYNADKQWFSNEAEMRQYLAGFRSAYADDVNNVISGEDGSNLGMWYHMTMTTSANTQKEPVSLTGCDLPPLTDDEQTQLDDLNEEAFSDMRSELMDEYPDTGHDDCPDCGDKFCMGCDFGLTEDEKMAQAGMSDEDIAGVHFIENLQNQVTEAENKAADALLKLAILTEQHECMEPSCRNSRMWAKRRAVADTIRAEVVVQPGFSLEDEDLGGLPTVEVKLADTPVGQLAADWREAEVALAKAADEYRDTMTPAGLRLSTKAAFMNSLDDLPF